MSPWLIGLTAAAAVGGIAAWWLLRQSPTKRGMKQFARSPRSMRLMGAVFEERERMLKEAASLSDQQIAKHVDKLLRADANLENTLGQVLQSVGKRAEAPLLAALDDPRCDPAINSEGPLSRNKFKVVTDILGNIGSQPLVARMAPLAKSSVEDHRKHAALCIAAVGSDDATPLTVAALADPEEYVRSYAMMGIQRATSAGRGTLAFRDATFTAVSRIATGEAGLSAFADGKAPNTLASIEPERARSVLNSPAALSDANPLLQYVLKQLNEMKLSVPRDTLLKLLAHAKANGKYPWTYVRAECLTMLTRTDPALAEQEIEAILTSNDKDSRNDASESLLELHDLGKATQLGWHLGPTSNSKPVQLVLAAWAFDGEVKNGGISQYFFNPSGDQWPIALEAFDTLEAKSCREILQSAVDFFGPEGPSRDRDNRIRQYAKVSDEREKILDDLSSRFYEDEDGLAVRIARYIVRNKTDFRAAIKAHVESETKEATT